MHEHATPRSASADLQGPERRDTGRTASSSRREKRERRASRWAGPSPRSPSTGSYRARAPGTPGRPGRGHARESATRRRRDHPLARRRPAERRGRRGRRHAGRRPTRTPFHATVSAPSRTARSGITRTRSRRVVRRGLFGALVIEPRAGTAEELDSPIVVHTCGGIPTPNGGRLARPVAQSRPGTNVRLRLINTDNVGRAEFALMGRLSGCGDRRHRAQRADAARGVGGRRWAAGGRRSTSASRCPSGQCAWRVAGSTVALVLSADGKGEPSLHARDDVRPGRATAARAAAVRPRLPTFDREFGLIIDKDPGFFNGRPGLQGDQRKSFPSRADAERRRG